MDKDEFNKLTDTGKWQALEAEQEKTTNLKRLVLGIVRLLFRPDEVIDAAMRWAERDKPKE